MLISNPFKKFGISQMWSTVHRAIDYPTPIGALFRAPADGVYRVLPSRLAWIPGYAGRRSELVLDDGRKIKFCHLDRHVARDGQRVERDVTVLAATGNTGFVLPRPTEARPWNGAHMHTFGENADGSRWDWTVGAVDPGTPEPVKPAPASVARKWTQLVIARGGVWLRSKPSTSGVKLRLLRYGEFVTTQGASGQWEAVTTSSGLKGWTHTDFIAIADKVVAAKGGLNLRSRPSTAGRVLTAIPNGAKVRIREVSGAWRRVTHKGVTGWVHGGFLK